MSDYDFTKIVHQLALQENIQECKIVYKYSTIKGDGYLGFVTANELVGSNKTINVVMKYSHRNQKFHKMFPIRDVYLNEIKFYEKIMPTFAKFQEEYNIDEPFDNTAKFYGSVKDPFDELLVLENLKSRNYDLWNRKELMNKEHLEYAVNVFGKFHGTSFAMQKVAPKTYNELIKGMDNCEVFKLLAGPTDLHNQMSKAIKDVLCIFDPVTEKSYRDKLEHLAENLKEDWNSTLDYSEDSIILQVDCWCNNMMFQYEDMNDRRKPKHMKLLDFQLFGLGSPALDLSYFFYTIAPKESFDNVDYFLKLYHESLAEHLKKFDVNVEDVFPYRKLEQHWKKVSKYGFILSFVIRKLMLMASEDAPDISENTADFIENVQIGTIQQKLYHEQIKDLVIHFIDRKFI